MPLYAVTFKVEMPVAASNEEEARRIGFEHLEEEVRNIIFPVSYIREINDLIDAPDWMPECIPWGSADDLTCEDILKGAK